MEATKAGYNSVVQWKDKEKGGFRACAYIFVLVAMDNMGFIANMCSFVLYFTKVMCFDSSGAANTVTNFLGSTFLLTVVGGFISDTYLSRFATCILFGALEVVAWAMLTIQAYSHKLHPEYCGKSSGVEGGVAWMLYSSLCLLALGSGGVRGALPSLGADQFDQNDPKEAKTLATYFNWLLLSTIVGAAIGVTAVVYVSTEVKWFWGFFISTVAAFIGFVALAIGKRSYRLQAPGEGPLVRIAQVIVVAIKNRKLPLPDNPAELYEINDKETVEERIAHTTQFRWLDNAAIVRKDTQPIPWEVCPVSQVEEVKVLTRMLPILFSTIIMNTCLAQLQTFSVEQGSFMNPYLSKLKVPVPSIPVIPIVFMIILIPIYEYVFVPFARKFTHHPAGITQLQRVGVGLVLSAISMAVAGAVEVKRRNEANKNPPHLISLFWLSFQYGIFGIADMFTLVGLLEFFYKEAPAGMRSLSTSFTWLSLSFGYFLSTIFVTVINSVTKRVTPTKQGWLHGQNINQNNVNLFYWFLAIVSCLNFFNYLYWASWYKYKKQEPDSEPRQTASTVSPIAKKQSTQDIETKTSNQALFTDQTDDLKENQESAAADQPGDENQESAAADQPGDDATENKATSC